MSLNYLVSNEADGHFGGVMALCVAPAGNVIYTAGLEGSVKVWDAESQALQKEIHGLYFVGCNSLSVAGDLLVLVTALGHIKICKTGDLSVIAQIDNLQYGPSWRGVLAPDASTLAVCTGSGTLLVYDLSDPSNPSQVAALPTRSQFGFDIAYSPDGKTISTGHKNGGVFLFDTAAGKLRHALAGQPDTVRCVAFSPASTLVAAAGEAGIITVHDTRTGEQRRSLQQSTQSNAVVYSLAWNQTGELLLTVNSDGKAKVWHVERGECVCTLTEAAGFLHCCAWVKKGKLEGIVVGGQEGKLRFYLPTTST